MMEAAQRVPRPIRRVLDDDHPSTNRLAVEFAYEIRVRQKVDLIGYFEQMNAMERERYYRYAKDNEQGYEQWELPPNFFYPEDGQVDAAPARWIEGVADTEWTDLDDFDVEVLLRPGGERTYARWTEQDYDLLLAHVPWLKTFHDLAADDDEIDDEELARIPGPNDLPLEGF